MSLNILSVLPADQATDIILQAAVMVTFDQEIDTTTFSEQTFLLSGPGTVGVSSPQGLIDNTPATQGTEYVQGTFSFAIDSQSRTVATFRPSRPLRPNVLYTVLISGVLSATEDALSGNYTFSFTTGVLNLKTPPAQNPLPAAVGRIRPGDLTVLPSSTIDNDLHRIEIDFPDNIDPTSFDVNAVSVSLEAFLLDPDVTVPTPTSSSVTVQGNKLIVELTFPGDPIAPTN
jgi:hypothetical protein